MHVKKYFSLLVLLFSISALSFGQNTNEKNLDLLSAKIIRVIRGEKKETVFVQTDKLLYHTGENIWFRAYLLNACTNKISRESKNLYVDLVNEKDSVISQLILNASQLKLNGNILLADNLSAGYYWLRVYTRQMLAEDINSICVQPVYVINNRFADQQTYDDEGTPQNAVQDKDTIPVIDFYPEGGSVITGAESVVAFHIHNNAGEPLMLSGYVKDSRDSVIAHFISDENGLGKFSFFPWSVRKYTVYLHSETKDIAFPLNAYNPYAAQLSVITDKNGTRMLRVLLEDSLMKKNKTTYVIGLSRDSLCFASTGSGNYELNIPEYHFPDGVVNFFLFDENNHLLSERSIYIVPQNAGDITINTDKDNYAAREKVNMNINVAGTGLKPEVALLAVSVTDSSLNIPGSNGFKSYRSFDESNFNEAAMMRSQLYSSEEKDLFMLTQKNNIEKRINNFEKDSSTDSDEIYNDDDSIFYISGKVTDKKNNPLAETPVALLSSAGNGVFEVDTTDSQGRFRFPLKGYSDSTLFRLQVPGKESVSQSAKITINSAAHYPHFSTPADLKKRFSPKEVEAFNIIKANHLRDTSSSETGKEWLKDVVVISTKKKQYNYDVEKRVSSFSHIIAPDKLGESGVGNIGNKILSVPGVHLLHGYLVIGGPGFGVSESSEPLLIMDGVEVSASNDSISGASSDMQFLNSLSSEYIDFIEVLTGPDAAAYGVRGGNGVILINTKSTANGFSKQDNGEKIFKSGGYSRTDEFAFPDYSIREMKNSKYPDKRSTIYWNGNILTDTSGKALVSFYTSDGPAVYTVTVSGITANGEIIYKTFSISRK